MLTLLQPAALIALLGLLAPLLIHLWERQQGRRVLVGSLRWLEAADARRMSSLRFSDVRRFLLRASIVVLFALLLARPAWRSAGPAPSARWILLTPDLSETGEPTGSGFANKVSVLPTAWPDTLRQEQTPMRWLATGFPELTAAPPAEDADYWSLLRELSRRPDAPDTVVVLGTPYLRRFSGPRPALPMVVEWLRPSEETERTFPVAAWTGPAEIHLITGRSDAFCTTMERHDLPKAEGAFSLPDGESGNRISLGGEYWRLQLGTDTIDARLLPSLRVLIAYAPSFEPDRRALEAALRAVGRFTEAAIDIESRSHSRVGAVDSSDYLFWLAEDPAPAVAVANRVVFQPDSLPGGPYFRPTEAGLVLRRRLLTGEEPPSEEDRLPRELVGLLFGRQVDYPRTYDQRLLDEGQIAPVPADPSPADLRSGQPADPFHLPLWGLLLGLFVAERLWRAHPKKEEVRAADLGKAHEKQ